MLKEGEEEGATEDDLGEELESSLALAEDEQGGPSLGFILGTHQHFTIHLLKIVH